MCQIPSSIVTGWMDQDFRRRMSSLFAFHNLAPHEHGTILYISVGVSIGIQQRPKRPRITKGGLDGAYEVINFHYHWSQNDEGSEHSINGRYFPLEVKVDVWKIRNSRLQIQILKTPR